MHHSLQIFFRRASSQRQIFFDVFTCYDVRGNSKLETTPMESPEHRMLSIKVTDLIVVFVDESERELSPDQSGLVMSWGRLLIVSNKTHGE